MLFICVYCYIQPVITITQIAAETLHVLMSLQFNSCYYISAYILGS